MGGSTDGTGISKPGIEFNFSVDPVANYVVFSSSTSNPAILLPFDYMIRDQVSSVRLLSINGFSSESILHSIIKPRIIAWHYRRYLIDGFKKNYTHYENNAENKNSHHRRIFSLFEDVRNDLIISSLAETQGYAE